jgi:hypothetical protein
MRHVMFVTTALLSIAFHPALAQTQSATPPAPAAPAAAAPAAAIIHYVTPDDMAAAVRELGYRAEIRKLSDTSKMISTGMDGLNVAIYLFGCTNGTQCPSLELETTFEKDPTFTLTLANNWNSQTRYTKAYIDPQSGALTFDYDFFLDGATMSAAKNAVVFYDGQLGKFAKFFRK